jgi:hypothetical protein
MSTKALVQAKDRRAAYSQVFGSTYIDTFPYDVEALMERGEVVPISLVVSLELGEPLPDLPE